MKAIMVLLFLIPLVLAAHVPSKNTKFSIKDYEGIYVLSTRTYISDGADGEEELTIFLVRPETENVKNTLVYTDLIGKRADLGKAEIFFVKIDFFPGERSGPNGFEITIEGYLKGKVVYHHSFIKKVGDFSFLCPNPDD
jgi:hypothetical protein